jgi:translation initiation factor IF-1
MAGAAGWNAGFPGLAAETRTGIILKGKTKQTRKEIAITSKEEKFDVEGIVTEAFPAGKFNIELDNGHELMGYVSGKMRRYNIRVLRGDRVKVELSPYDMERGRIVYRYKRKKPKIKKLIQKSAPAFTN